MLAEKLFGDAGKYVVLAVGFFVASAGGTLYTFGGYSVQLGQAIGKSNVDFFGSCGDFGLYLGFMFGLWFDLQGPSPPMIAGSLLTFCGYFGVWLQASGRVEPVIWTFYILYFMIGQGSYCLFICAMSTNVRNFPAIQTGKIAALLLFAFSLPAVLLTVVYNHVLDQSVVSYLALFTIYCTTAGILGLFFITEIPLKKIEPSENPYENNEIEEKIEEKTIISVHPEMISQVSVWKTMCFLDLWLLFWAFFGVSGAGLMWKNVLGSVASSFGMETAIGGLVITWGSLSAISRLIFGGLADYFGAQIPRPFWLVFGSSICFAVHFWFLFADGNYILWVVSIGTGIAYGTAFSLCNSLLLIYFTVKDSGLKIGLLSLAPAFGGTAATYLAGDLSKERAPEGDITQCVKDDHCYEYVFIMSSTLLLISTILFAVLGVRHYQRTQRKTCALLIQEEVPYV